ncbi:GNAT family N-acetyltransferase [Oryzibacter oryziterrae]|uniref:GNAT family N-acetyltransferase n=1 Tax=Oryzibacter oryziterrae TaxID=2766474 RepID=UPI001F16275F|nr:GNAT family N-acetyltransferase [Oryzibacter oryziterrae]
MRVITGTFGGNRNRAPLEPTLHTARLVLRPLEVGDRRAITEYLCDRDVSRWLVRVPFPYRLVDADAFIEQCRITGRMGTALTLGLTLPNDPEARIFGVVALHSLDMEPEFGFWLAQPFWGRGLMSEAAEALLAFAYANLPIDTVISGAFAGNQASLAIQARQGFKVIGQSRKLSLAEGVMLDHVDTSLDRAAHAGRQPRP